MVHLLRVWGTFSVVHVCSDESVRTNSQLSVRTVMVPLSPLLASVAFPMGLSPCSVPSCDAVLSSPGLPREKCGH